MGGGAVTATSTNTECFTTPSNTANTVTVKFDKYTAQTSQIIMEVAETAEYAAGTVVFNVTAALGENTLRFSSYSGTASYGTPVTFTVKTNTSGVNLSVVSSNSNYVTASISGSTVTVTAVDCSLPNHTITEKAP